MSDCERLQRSDARLRRLVAHLHSLGPRPVYEFVREIIEGGDVVESLETYSRLDSSIVQYLGADRLVPDLVVIDGGAA